MKFIPNNVSFDHSIDVADKTAFNEDGKFLRGVICAGHPSPERLQAMSRDPVTETAPSWVIEVR
jgi:arylesterase/paraoxonase